MCLFRWRWGLSLESYPCSLPLCCCVLVCVPLRTVPIELWTTPRSQEPPSGVQTFNVNAAPGRDRRSEARVFAPCQHCQSSSSETGQGCFAVHDPIATPSPCIPPRSFTREGVTQFLSFICECSPLSRLRCVLLLFVNGPASGTSRMCDTCFFRCTFRHRAALPLSFAVLDFASPSTRCCVISCPIHLLCPFSATCCILSPLVCFPPPPPPITHVVCFPSLWRRFPPFPSTCSRWFSLCFVLLFLGLSPSVHSRRVPGTTLGFCCAPLFHYRPNRNPIQTYKVLIGAESRAGVWSAQNNTNEKI